MGALADFAFSMQMRDTIDRIVKASIESLRPRYRYATVESIDRVTRKCAVIFNGETGSVLVNMGSVQPSAVGQIVRVEGIATDKFITDVMGAAYIEDLVNTRGKLLSNVTKYQAALNGGGVKTATSGRDIAWSQRFIATSVSERGPDWGTEGYFDITMPPDTTVIPAVGGGPSVTVTSGLITLPVWGALFYIPPLGTVNTSVPENFRIVQFDGGATTFTIPDEWIFIVGHNNDTQSSMFKWGDGTFSDPWRDLALTSGWIPHNSTQPQPSYRKIGNTVHLHGLLKKSTTPAVEDQMAVLPVGFRPESNLGQVHFLIDCANAAGGIGITNTGLIIYKAGSNTWMSLDNVRFEAEF